MDYENYKKISKARALISDALILRDLKEGSLLERQLDRAHAALTEAMGTVCRENPEIEAILDRQLRELYEPAKEEE